MKENRNLKVEVVVTVEIVVVRRETSKATSSKRMRTGSEGDSKCKMILQTLKSSKTRIVLFTSKTRIAL